MSVAPAVPRWGVVPHHACGPIIPILRFVGALPGSLAAKKTSSARTWLLGKVCACRAGDPRRRGRQWSFGEPDDGFHDLFSPGGDGYYEPTCWFRIV